jgi:hypothetical protein
LNERRSQRHHLAESSSSTEKRFDNSEDHVAAEIVRHLGTLGTSIGLLARVSYNFCKLNYYVIERTFSDIVLLKDISRYLKN